MTYYARTRFNARGKVHWTRHTKLQSKTICGIETTDAAALFTIEVVNCPNCKRSMMYSWLETPQTETLVIE